MEFIALKELVKWLPLLVALVAGFFALQQIKSNNITNARLKWLELFKQIISDFLSESIILQLKDGVSRGISEHKNIDNRLQLLNDKLTESYLEHLKTLTAKYYLIKLNLNPKEELHNKFEKLLEDYMELINQIPQVKDKAKASQLLKDLTTTSNNIVLLNRYLVKLEWEKTKRHSLNRFFYFKIGKGKKLLQESLALKLDINKWVQNTSGNN